MKGTVLGFDGSSGAITGEDGKRYSFASAEWKSETPAKAGDEVDFVAEGGAATEIYALKRTFTASLPKMSTSGGQGAGAQGAGFDAAAFFSRPQVILYCLAIVAFFFFDLLESGNVGATAYDLPGALADVSEMLGGWTGSVEDANGPGFGFRLASELAVLMWAIPLSCLYGLYREYSGRRLRRMEIISALGCFYSMFVFVLVLGAENKLSRSRDFSDLADLGLGGYAFLACSIGFIITAIAVKKQAPATTAS